MNDLLLDHWTVFLYELDRWVGAPSQTRGRLLSVGGKEC